MSKASKPATPRHNSSSTTRIRQLTSQAQQYLNRSQQSHIYMGLGNIRDITESIIRLSPEEIEQDLNVMTDLFSYTHSSVSEEEQEVVKTLKDLAVKPDEDSSNRLDR